MTSNAIRWNVRKPNQYEFICDWCGKKFYGDKRNQRFCCPEHTNEYHARRANLSRHRLKKAIHLAYGGNVLFGVPPALRTYVLDEDQGDYYRYSELGLDDGTSEVLGLLQKGTVWAKHAELDMPRHPFAELLAALKVRLDLEEQNEKPPPTFYPAL